MVTKRLSECNSFINTKKAFKKLYMFYFETFRIILKIYLQSKNKATLGNAINSKPKHSVTQKITVWRKKTSDEKPRPPTNPVKFAKSKSRTNSYADSAKAKLK